MNLRGIVPYDEQTGRGTVRHLFTRCAMHTPDAVLCIVSARGFGVKTEELIAYLREHCPELTGIVLDINKQKGNVVLAGDFLYTLGFTGADRPALWADVHALAAGVLSGQSRAGRAAV